MDFQEPIRLKIRNKQFCLNATDIMRAPESRLANLSPQDSNYNSKNEEFFFNRNPFIFQFIMDFYAGEDLHFPSFICHETVRCELEFWKLSLDHLAPCCLASYMEAQHKKSLVEKIRREMTPLWERIQKGRRDKTGSKIKPGDSNTNPEKSRMGLRLRLWLLLEDPSYSIASMVWSLFFFAIILTSNLVLCLETLPDFRIFDNATWHEYMNLTDRRVRFMMVESAPSAALLNVEFFTVMILLLDVVLRFSLSPNKCRFFTSVLNIIQIIILIPSLVELTLIVTNYSTKALPDAVVLFLGVMRLLRVALVLRSANGYPSLKILGLSIIGSWRELVLMVMILFISVFIFSFLLFYSEMNFSDNIENIPVALWWAVITMTTVGYGDYVPKSVPGIIVGNVCAVCGILLIALPVAVIGNTFNQYYTAMYRYERTKRRKKVRSPCF